VTNCLSDGKTITRATTKTIATCTQTINNTYQQAQKLAATHAQIKQANE
jgi:hypothetical protein